MRTASPGSVLKRELEERPSVVIDLPAGVIEGIINGEVVVTIDIGMKLASAFGTTLGFWIKLQKEWEKSK